ncbi:phosphate ABC transporter permease subunit PstC [Agrococcus sp. HG114]|uniref:phosphate ABC transporter permease subunit PstC n=1 Tax=Agrococcus sp. HG114 TaxID=2969757 RepID=UPI00215A7BBD|nr:phosphate ABC transporter permease subunit PstC [Agrococcus sp. HG114]MCR8670942.1 phosphate ABC transporter permease subunit PstC [Agrococcus sp. HG114]
MTTAAPAATTRAAAPNRPADVIFKAVSTTAGVLILLALAGVAIFLVAQAVPALIGPLPEDDSFWAWVWPLTFGTLWSSFLAMLMAVPIAIAIALFITHYAPRRVASVLGYAIDLLAAIPSVIYGLWGIAVLAPFMQPAYTWLAQNLGWIPLFTPPASGTGRTILTAAIVLAVMVLPIITALCREIFLQTPRLNEEASLALGATRWEMIRMAVLPHGRSGIIASSILGLGRALGETMAVAMVLASAGAVTFVVVGSQNPSTIAANIALRFPEAHGITVNMLIGSGLVLFAITLLVNAISRWIIAKTTVDGGR